MAGTEIGGGFLSGTLLQPQAPSTFSTPTVGTRLALLTADGRQSLHGRCAADASICHGTNRREYLSHLMLAVMCPDSVMTLL